MEDHVRSAVASGDVSAYEQVLHVLTDEGSGETAKAGAAQLLAAHWNAFPSKASAVVEALLGACGGKNANSVRIHSIIALSNVVKQAKEPLAQEDMDKISAFTKEALSVENRGVLVRHLTGLSKLLEGPKPESSTQVSTEGGGRLGKKELPVPPSPYLMLRHFPRDTTNNMLYDYFSAIEPSVKISLHTPPNGHSHAFINFSSTEKATAAITYCRNQPFRNGYRLNALFARGRAVPTVDFHRVGAFPTDWTQHTALWDSTLEQLQREYPKKWTVRSPGVISFESKDICQHLVQFGLFVNDTQLFVVYNAAEQRREDKVVPPYRLNDLKQLNSPARTNSPRQPLEANNKPEPLESGEIEAGEISDKNDTTVGASTLESKSDQPSSWGPPSRNEPNAQQEQQASSSWGPPSRPSENNVQPRNEPPPRNEPRKNRSAERAPPGRATLGALARSNNRSPPRPPNRSRSREARRGGPPRQYSPPRGRPPARSRSKEPFRPSSRGNSRERQLRDVPPPLNRNRETLRDKANRPNNRSRSREPRRPMSPPRRPYSPPRQAPRRPRSPPRRPNLPPSPGRPRSPGYRGSPMPVNGSPRPPSRDFREEPRKDDFNRREEGRDEQPRNAWQRSRSRSREAKPSTRPREVERTNLEGTTRDNRSLADIARVGGADVIARNSPRPAPSKPEVAVTKDTRSLAEIAAAAAAVVKRPRSPSPPKEVIADRQQPDYSNVVFDPLPTDADDVPRRVVSPSPVVVAEERNHASPAVEDNSHSIQNILNPKPAKRPKLVDDLDELAVDYEDDDE